MCSTKYRRGTVRNPFDVGEIVVDKKGNKYSVLGRTREYHMCYVLSAGGGKIIRLFSLNLTSTNKFEPYITVQHTEDNGRGYWIRKTVFPKWGIPGQITELRRYYNGGLAIVVGDKIYTTQEIA